MELTKILQLTPEYRDYIWGGRRLRESGERTAEAWVIFEKNRVANGPHVGRTLADLAQEFGEALIGTHATRYTGNRFPLLIKLLDCAAWLSLQVHPNDEQAKLLEGPDHFGKTEAWHIIEADDRAQLIAGMLAGTEKQILEAAIRNNKLIEHVRFLDIQAGDSVFMPPCTIHALGPGLLIYEVQQTSDITYRVYDWGRPETPTRRLHIEKSLEVVDPQSSVEVLPMHPSPNSSVTQLITCPFFTLEHIHGAGQPIELSTQNGSFHTLTVINGKARIQAGSETVKLDRFESALIPANCGDYSIQPIGQCALLKSSVEPYSG